ncbi:MAG: hypothetical protein KKB30_02940 [Proteobacteria bacterium]|nr:hypothetical protein [Pseudomonadota bacterium]MBU1716057.1 hypothetical protein [Pseudomonadota bacterium]
MPGLQVINGRGLADALWTMLSVVLAWAILTGCAAGVTAEEPSPPVMVEKKVVSYDTLRPDVSGSEHHSSGLGARQINIAGLKSRSNTYAGQKVLLSGVFKGWKGACFGAPPVTRSDWMLEDDSGCLYVTGPLPAGLDALKPNSEQIMVKGLVLTDRKGEPYLEAESVTIN